MMQYSKLAGSVLVVIATTLHCLGQKITIPARGELHFSAGYNFPVGPKNVGGDFTLLANTKPGPSAEIKYITMLKKNVFVGGWISTVKFRNWTVSDSSLFNGTSVNFISLGPSILYRPWATRKIRNKLNLDISVSPGVSRVTVNTDPESEINGDPNADPLRVTSFRFTVGLHAGLSYAFGHSTGMTLRCGYQYTSADSQIFPDKNFSYLNVSVGVFFRLSHDKRYKYSAL